MKIADFYRARLDEDEAKAKAAPWELDDGRWPFWVDTDDEGDFERAEQYRDHYRPSRMLREVEAKRKVLDEHFPKVRRPFVDIYDDVCEVCGDAYPCVTVRLGVLPYADHEDYDERWRP